ncbi:hypothetical protein G5B30_04025 [Sphingobacterium sp. SGG-5]|uniref:hypothetical protein n=1 Tax=Sphingobacterium sp. SGG-5 TaxID=2710881 RepID=UPI0013EBC3F3|nr:hypothetical protein [Sphingobacterium sp. SGG-5]NGM61082.1 hypothetical protein [Sphingobacterium sp. SGG-5]
MSRFTRVEFSTFLINLMAEKDFLGLVVAASEACGKRFFRRFRLEKTEVFFI